ncbi:alpha/beta-hydrolase [Mycena floridula]|nr:alpha/beta-hydrolase [Mycena floridula]
MLLTSLVSSLVLASFVSAAPATIGMPPVDPQALLCKIPIISKLLCKRVSSGTCPAVKTKLGVASGVVTPDAANRYTVKYASAERWAESKLVTTWTFPNGGSNATAMPLACPQTDLDSSLYSEDCLSMVLYVPSSLVGMTTGVPTFVWLPGGSFVFGSAGDAGLDGSKLAVATNSIVAVVQHRLGALGFMSPDGNTNLAVKDVMNALRFLQTVVPSFGGSASKITLAGQSSGANMVRALLATPSASALFQQAIIQSDPMDYGFYSLASHTTLQDYFTGLTNCAATDKACLAALSLDSILDAQSDLTTNALSLDASATQNESIRPVRDGTLITSPMDSTAQFPSVNKPILLSTVQNEAGPTIYSWFDTPQPEAAFPVISAGTLGQDRTTVITQSTFYPGIILLDGSIDARQQVEKLGTDYLWKCSGWTFARNWVSNGGTAYVGLYTVGATYVSNADIDFCSQPGSVCHQDDIEIVFGTVLSPTPPQSALITEVQARYKAFLNTGNPNVGGLRTWTKAGTSNVNAYNLGGTTAIPVDACTPTFWGDAVQYDYQIFDI